LSGTRHDVGSVESFADGSLTKVDIDGQDVVVVHHGGEFFAVPDRCTHAKKPLHDGELQDGKIRCIYHGATFDLRTGKASLPAIKPLACYATEVEDGRVYVTPQA
jgi:nitrite reductase/ring-hydroxylating ferredoxin subunit